MEKEIGSERILTTINVLHDAATKAEECSEYLQNTSTTIKKLKSENEHLSYHLRTAQYELITKERQFQDALKTERDAFNDMQTRLLQRQKELEQTIKDVQDDMKQKTQVDDISDDKRPTKIAERYLDLYDIEWTDAYEEIEKDFKTEEKITQELLRILKKIMEFCTYLAKQQDVNVHNALLMNNKETDNGLLKEASKQLSSCKKRISPGICEDIYKLYISKLQQSTSSGCIRELRITTFIKACISVCWMCLIQFPPMKMEFDVKAHRKKFKEDMYKPYTMCGKKMDFIVWPVLLLYENGPVAAKGIAQGIEEGRTRRFHETVHNRRTSSPNRMRVTRSQSSSDLAMSPSPEPKRGIGQLFQKFLPQRRGRSNSIGSLSTYI